MWVCAAWFSVHKGSGNAMHVCLANSKSAGRVVSHRRRSIMHSVLALAHSISARKKSELFGGIGLARYCVTEGLAGLGFS